MQFVSFCALCSRRRVSAADKCNTFCSTMHKKGPTAHTHTRHTLTLAANGVNSFTKCFLWQWPIAFGRPAPATAARDTFILTALQMQIQVGVDVGSHASEPRPKQL